MESVAQSFKIEIKVGLDVDDRSKVRVLVFALLLLILRAELLMGPPDLASAI